MTIDEAVKEAERQINQSQYLRECCSGVYETGLNTIYENKSEMLRTLLRHIKQQQAEIELLNKGLNWKDKVIELAQRKQSEVKEQMKPFEDMRKFMMFGNAEQMQEYCLKIQSENDKLKAQQPVLCRECIYSELFLSDLTHVECHNQNWVNSDFNVCMNLNGFCSYGERKEVKVDE